MSKWISVKDFMESSLAGYCWGVDSDGYVDICFYRRGNFYLGDGESNDVIVPAVVMAMNIEVPQAPELP